MKKKYLAGAVSLACLFLYGCGGGSDGGSNNDNGGGDDTEIPEIPGEPSDPSSAVAPYHYDKYHNILEASVLQRSDPNEGWDDGDKENVAEPSDFKIGYFDEYFYADSVSENLVFKMSGYKNRAELRVSENFDTAEQGTQRVLSSSFMPVGLEEALSSDPSGDEVTFLQVHNKGTDEGGTGYIPHPLLRVTYETERDGKTGHYWAVLKTNAINCSDDGGTPDDPGCDSEVAYTRFDLGEASLNSMTDINVTVRESQLLVDVNDVNKVDYDISYWSHLLSYFKAGVYNQYDDGEGINAWSEVWFKTLNVGQSNYNSAGDWDIDEWKLTIPESKNSWYGSGGDSAAELEPEHCDSSKDILSNASVVEFTYPSGDIEFFSVEDGRMHFRADIGYGSSTANATYMRSELRELFNAKTVDTCSTENTDTSWFIEDTATGTSVHTLISQLRIERYPDVSEPKVVVGQVHGWKIDKALVKLLWEGNNKPVRVILNQHKEDGNPFSIELGTYSKGEEWQYKIEVDSNGIVLETQLLDGSEKESKTLPWGENFKDKDGNTVMLDDSWTDSDVAYYFKAGIYPQIAIDTNNAGKRFDVSFSKIDVNHK